VQPIQRVDGDAEGRVEAERDVGAGHVVVDGLRNANDRDPLGREAPGDGQAAVAADHHQAVDPVSGGGGQHRVGPVLVGARAGPVDRRGSRRRGWGAAQGHDAGDLVEAERPRLVREEAGEAVEEAGDPHAVPMDRRPDDGPERGVHAGTVAPRGP
jgi:hypothetical protein